MSENQGVDFLDGDIVWVKISSYWWPAEVKNDNNTREEILGMKKPPLAVVKFFNEDAYEFIKSASTIYPYNCERKNDFIRKGMDAFRANNPHMEKFPIDVSAAEVKTNGNPNILSDPLFAPQKKTNIVAEVFGSGKKPLKEGIRRSKGRPSTSKNSPQKSKVHITHRRFLGYDDYEAKICVQYPGKDGTFHNEEEEIKQMNSEEDSKKYTCSTCDFQTNRLDVMLFHVNCHIKGFCMTPSTPNSKKKSPRRKKAKIHKQFDDDDMEKSSTTNIDTETSDEEYKTTPKAKQKRKRKSNVSKKLKDKRASAGEKQDPNVRAEVILADWEEDSDEVDEFNDTKMNTSDDHLEKTLEKSDGKDTSKSCFDFEDEDEDNSVVHTAVGRKIPRVIPPTDKRKSANDDNEASLPLAEDDENRMELLKENEKVDNSNESTSKESIESNEQNNEFKNLLDTTCLPELPKVPEIAKLTENDTDCTSDSKTQVKDDALPIKKNEIATKLTNPKKRFVKSFEDFELMQNEQRRIAMETEKQQKLKNDPAPDLPLNIESVTKPKSPIKAESPKKCDTISINEVSIQSESLEKGKESKSDVTVSTVRGSNKSKVEETETKVEISKLKCQLMSKISEDDSDSLRPSTAKELKVNQLKSSYTGSKSPRSKILETYKKGNEPIKQRRSSDRKRKQIITAEDELNDPSFIEQKKEPQLQHSPKKSKYLKYDDSSTLKSENLPKQKDIAKSKADTPIKSINDDEEYTSKRKLRKSIEVQHKKTQEISPKKVESPKIDNEIDTMQYNFQDETSSSSCSDAKTNQTTTESSSLSEDSSNSSSVNDDQQQQQPLTNNEIRLKCTNVEQENGDDIDISIKTNLTNLSNDNEMSALTTLAAVSELKTNYDNHKTRQIDHSSSSSSLSTSSTVKSKLDKENSNVEEFEFINKMIPPPLIPNESELITIDGNLTVVSEKDLADGQVEITANVSDTNKKPVTLTSFSMDFSEGNNSDSTNNSLFNLNELPDNFDKQDIKATEDIKISNLPATELVNTENILTKNKESIVESTNLINNDTNKIDSLTNKGIINVVEDNLQIEQQSPIVQQTFCAQESIDDKLINIKKTYPVPDKPPSKLLERLTDVNVKEAQHLIKTVKSTSETKAVPIKDNKFLTPSVTTSSITTEMKNTKLIIKSSVISKAKTVSSLQIPITTQSLSTTTTTTKTTTKPIILSEKIIKPDRKIQETITSNVSVQKVTSKRNMVDADDIDTFIIQKSTNINLGTSDEDTNSGIDESASYVLKKVKKSDTDELSKYNKKGLLTQSSSSTSTLTTPIAKKRGRAKILQQTIITPSGEIIQPTVSTTSTTSSSTVSATAAVIDDNVFDINSMPIVLSDQILTPESLENMPIYLTTDGVQQVVEPIVTTKPTTIVKKTVAHSQPQMRILNKTVASAASPSSSTSQQLVTPTSDKKMIKTKVVSNSSMVGGTKIIKRTFTQTPSNKGNKYMIVTQASSTPSKYTVGKKQTIIKKPNEMTQIHGGSLTKVSNLTPESGGNKIMIFTNQQGQQQRVLLTPAHQKLIGIPTSSTTKTKTVIKSNIMQKTGNTIKDNKLITTSGTVGITSKSNVISLNTSTQRSSIVLNSNQNIIQTTPITTYQTKTLRVDNKSMPSTTMGHRKIQMHSQRVNVKQQPTQKTILIKNQHGQTVRRIQGTDDALLDQQVAEQLEAIKATSSLQQKKTESFSKTPTQQQQQQQRVVKRYTKKITPVTPSTHTTSTTTVVESPKTMVQKHVLTKTLTETSTAVPPPLAPISPKKIDSVQKQQQQQQQQFETKLHLSTASSASTSTNVTSKNENKTQSERPLNQLVIQDAMGNQTTITEGQILALPSETVDGQPQSYMLVTLDESGNLTPLNNEALMSLDPNLGLSGDLGNTVLQIEQGPSQDELQSIDTNTTNISTTSTLSNIQTTNIDTVLVDEKIQQSDIVKTKLKLKENQTIIETSQIQSEQQLPDPQNPENLEQTVMQQVNCTVSGEPGQQLIVTGDPIATQKFLESLSEGNTDLANILANAEGSSILIQADGQQMLLSVNSDNLNVSECSEGGGNPIFATQPSKNQDILAAALADTDVFQQEQNNTQSKAIQSQLSPNSSSLYSMNVGNVLETSLTLNSPIMTPLEVPSTNNKKISDENDILNQVPKNVDLPITITDPNISHTVNQQQVATLMANELQTNLELQLPITDSAISVTSTEINSPNFVYSLPNLDESVDMDQKPFNSSMPLLSEDSEENSTTNINEKNDIVKNEDKTQIKTDTVPVIKTSPKPSSVKDDNEQVDDVKNYDDLIVKKLDTSEKNFLEENEGLCTLGGEMCSSLSEPPPDMFDLSDVLNPPLKQSITSTSSSSSPSSSINNKQLINDDSNSSKSELKIDETINQDPTEDDSPNSLNEDSCEIPMQPEIVTDLSNEDFNINKNNNIKNEVEK